MLQRLKPSFLPAITWLVISTVLLTIPGSTLPSEDWLGKIWFDKWVHVGMFGVMVFLWCWGLLRNRERNSGLRRLFLGMTIIWILYGIGMEFIQKYFIPGRSFDLGDILADTIGSVAGVIFSIRRYIKK